MYGRTKMRRRDANPFAKQTFDLAAVEAAEHIRSHNYRAAISLGRFGGGRGGMATPARLSLEKQSEAAQKVDPGEIR